MKKCGENPTIITINKVISCEYCGVTCKTIRTITDHYKICKIFKNIKQENSRLDKTPVTSDTSSIHITNNTNNTNIINNTNNITNNILVPVQVQIPLRSYYDPKIPDDIDDICEEAWDRMKCVPTYIERVYFNNDIPENHSICTSNIRATLGTKIYDGDKWIIASTNHIVGSMVTNTHTILDKWARANKKRSKYLDTYNNYVRENKNILASNAVQERNEIKSLLYQGHKDGKVNTKSTTVVYIPRND